MLYRPLIAGLLAVGLTPPADAAVLIPASACVVLDDPVDDVRLNDSFGGDPVVHDEHLDAPVTGSIDPDTGTITVYVPDRYLGIRAPRTRVRLTGCTLDVTEHFVRESPPAPPLYVHDIGTSRKTYRVGQTCRPSTSGPKSPMSRT